MATLEDWNAYMGALMDLAYIEDDLRDALQAYGEPAITLAERILFERFGVQ